MSTKSERSIKRFLILERLLRGSSFRISQMELSSNPLHEDVLSIEVSELMDPFTSADSNSQQV